MKDLTAVLRLVGALITFMAATSGVVHASEVSQPALLIASDRLEGSPYEQTVVLAAPLPNGGHVGFILNRPTHVKLATLFPEHEPSRNVVEPVYVGGPMLSHALFALTRKASEGPGKVIEVMPGLFAALDAVSVDRIIETTPNDARYFVGMMIWDPQDLEEEVEKGAWNAVPADADTVFRARPAGLWQSLRRSIGSDDHGKRGYI